jgi:hypothetical protein
MGFRFAVAIACVVFLFEARRARAKVVLARCPSAAPPGCIRQHEQVQAAEQEQGEREKR